MSCLASWFIFELIGVGAAVDLREIQAFKNVSLQMMIDQTFIFHRIFFFKLHLIQVLTFNINGQVNGSGTLLALPASASTKNYRFHSFCFHNPGL